MLPTLVILLALAHAPTVPASYTAGSSTKQIDQRVIDLAASSKTDAAGVIWVHHYSDERDAKSSRNALGRNDPLRSPDAPLWFSLEAHPSIHRDADDVTKRAEARVWRDWLPADAKALGQGLLVRAVSSERVAGGHRVLRLQHPLHQDSGNFDDAFILFDLPDELLDDNRQLTQPIEISLVRNAQYETTGGSFPSGTASPESLRQSTARSRLLWPSQWTFVRVIQAGPPPADPRQLRQTTPEEVLAHLEAGKAPGIPTWTSRWTGKAWDWNLRWTPIKPPASAPPPAPESAPKAP